MPRPAKTIRQHLLQGTVPQCKPEKPSVFEGGRPRIPSHLTSKVARTEFKKNVRFLELRGTCTEGDQALLAVHAEVFARWVACKEQIGDKLMVLTIVLDSNGVAREVWKLNPLLKVAQACEARLAALSDALGLTPKAREKVKQTAVNTKEEIVPGSIADLYPNLLVVGGKK